MLRIALCDDDRLFIGREKLLVDKCMTDKNLEFAIDLFASGEELLKADIFQYNLIFLDMEMPEMPGMDVAVELRNRGYKAEVAFITAYIEYSPQGYYVGALRYILKEQVLNNSFPIEECISAFLRKYNIRQAEVEIEFDNCTKRVNTSSIVYIEMLNRYIYFYILEDDELKKYRVKGRHKLTEYIYLDEYYIISIHKSFLVNLEFIKKLIRYKVELKLDKKEIEVAQKKYDEVRKLYMEYKGGLR